VRKHSALWMAGILTLVGCQAAQETAQEAAQEVSGLPETTSVLELEVGTCVNDADTPLSADLASIPTVPCSQPHDSELYASIALENGPYPGADRLVSQGQSFCQERFSDFVGIDFRSSMLDFHIYYPTPSSWAAGDRLIYCMVFDPGLRVIGTLEGSQR